MTFKKGLPAANGSSLPQDIRRTIQFPLPEPAVRLDGPGRYLAPGGTLRVPVRATNLKEFHATLRPVFANNLVELARRESDGWWGDLTDDLDGARRGVTNALPSAPDGAPVAAAVDLRALAAGELRGA